MRASDRSAFVRLANKRVPKAVHAIGLIANLSSKANYSYGDKDAAMIIKTLKSAVAECEARFSGRDPVVNGFKLEE